MKFMMQPLKRNVKIRTLPGYSVKINDITLYADVNGMVEIALPLGSYTIYVNGIEKELIV